MLGRKGVAVTLRILFDKKDCFHLMGLQYLVDRPELSRERGKVFDEIADGTIKVWHIVYQNEKSNVGGHMTWNIRISI